MKLGVNIDHIATIREARKSDEPDPVYAAMLAEMGGADGITVHLRQDRRHIRERDLELLRHTIRTKLNLEMAPSMEMVKIAMLYKPDCCTLVPESPEEITTSGGLDVIVWQEKLLDVIGNLKSAGIEISIFVDPEVEQIKAANRLGVTAIEINTGKYAENWKLAKFSFFLEKIAQAAAFARKLKMKVLAGHGLNYQNVGNIVQLKDIEELNIGHSIVANAAYLGMEKAVARMKELLKR